MKYFCVIVLGALLSVSAYTASAQNERALHPRIARAIEKLRDARAYLEEAPHDFGGYKAEAIQATDDAINALNLALAYRAGADNANPSLPDLPVPDDRAMHPRIATAIAALKDANAYLEAAADDFGGYKAGAIRATDNAMRELNLALAYRAGSDSTSASVRITYVPGSSKKVCQLTGDIDWETGRPTAARTFSNFGLDAGDLGYPVEHNGKLILLFGDSWPPPHGGGPGGEVPPDDAVGVTTRTTPPTKDDGKCLEIGVYHTATRKFAPAAIVGPTKVKQGFFNVPSGGVSVGGALYAFFWTNHCYDPNPLSPSQTNPLVRPPVNPNRDCPETDDRNSVGKAVLARSDDDGRTFHQVVPMPTGFVYSTAVNATLVPGLPEEQRLGVFIFGVPRYRASVPYLAYAPVDSLADTATWRFFTGLGKDGQPKWVSRAVWLHPDLGNVTGLPYWRPPGEPELFSPKLEAERGIGEMSITWNRPLNMWLLLYNGPAGIETRVARAPWGPWSLPTPILTGQDDVNCRLVMTPEGCGNRRDFWPTEHKNGKFVGGGFYAPYVLNRYTTAVEGDGRRSTIYWLLSTWNPYEVSVMRTTLQLENGNDSQSGDEAQTGWKALEVAFAIPDRPGFFRNLPTDKAPSAIWPQSQGIAAALDLAKLSGNYAKARELLATTDAYKFGDGYAPTVQPTPPNASRIPARFYDDNGVVGLDLMQAYAQTGDQTYLGKAKELFKFIRTGQHSGGGMLWCETSDPASTAMSATGSDTEFALRLYIATNDQEYLRFAEANYRYMQENFLVTRDGQRLSKWLYWGQVGKVSCPAPVREGNDERVVRPPNNAVPANVPSERADIHSYNQGFPIAIDVLFFRITRDKNYLTNANRTAEAALRYWSGETLWHEAPAFNVFFFRSLLALDLVAPNPAYRKALDGYLRDVWTKARDPKTGLFDQGGIHAGQAINYLEQASLIQLFALNH